MVRGFLFAVVVFGMLVGRVPLAWGVDKHVQADQLIREGYQLRVKGDPAGALRLFQRAHEIEPSARTLAQMGLAEADLQRWGEAEAHLTAAVALGADPWVVKNRAAIDQALVVVRKNSEQGKKSPVAPFATPVTRLIDAGMAAREKGDHQAALQLFQQAHDLEPAPITLGLQGGEEYVLARWDEAEAHLVGALDQKDNEWVGRYRLRLEKALSDIRAHIGELTVAGSPPGAQIYVNGRNRGTLPLKGPLRVNEGDLGIQITAAGYQPYVGHVQVVARASTPLAVALEKQKLVEVPPLPISQTSVQDSGATSGLRTAAWATAGGSVVALGAGLVLRAIRENKLDAFNRSCRLDENNMNRPMRFPVGGTGPDPCQGLYDKWDSAKPWPTVGYAVAGALAVTSGVLFAIAQQDSASAKHASVDCRLGVGFATCGGTF